MSIIDVVLTIILSGFVFYGFFFGLIRMVGNLAGFIAGVWVASHYYLLAYAFIARFYAGYSNIIKLLTFLIVLSLVSKAVSLLFVIIDKTYHIIAIIPFLKTFNRLGGAIFGFIEGSLAISLAFYFAVKNPITNLLFERFMPESQLVDYFKKIGEISASFLPMIIDNLKKYL